MQLSTSLAARRSSLLQGSALASRHARRPVAVSVTGIKCFKETKEGEQTQTRREKKISKFRQQLEKSGVNKDVAAKILGTWEKQIGQDFKAKDLRKVFVKSLTLPAGYLLVQLLFDAGAAYGSYYAGEAAGVARAFGGQPGWLTIPLQALAFTLAGYYATGVFFDVFRLTALTFASVNFSTNSGAFLEAVREISGGSTGLHTLDKAREAINMAKVLSGLGKAADALKKEFGGNDVNSLRDLGAYLTLERAERAFGFDAAKLGLSNEEAAEIAVAFDKFDTNDDGVLSLQEFRKLISEYASELSGREVEAALELLDSNKDGEIEFKEFVAWWQNQVA